MNLIPNYFKSNVLELKFKVCTHYIYFSHVLLFGLGCYWAYKILVFQNSLEKFLHSALILTIG